MGSAPASPTLQSTLHGASGDPQSSLLPSEAAPAKRYQASGQPCGKYLSRNRATGLAGVPSLTHGSCHDNRDQGEPPVPMPIRGDPRPGRSAFEKTLGPIGARLTFTSLTLSGGGPARAAQSPSGKGARASSPRALRCAGSLLTLRHSAGGRPPFRHPPSPAGGECETWREENPGRDRRSGPGGQEQGKGEGGPGATPRGHLGVRAFPGHSVPRLEARLTPGLRIRAPDESTEKGPDKGNSGEKKKKKKKGPAYCR